MDVGVGVFNHHTLLVILRMPSHQNRAVMTMVQCTVAAYEYQRVTSGKRSNEYPDIEVWRGTLGNLPLCFSGCPPNILLQESRSAQLYVPGNATEYFLSKSEDEWVEKGSEITASTVCDHCYAICKYG